MCISLSPFRPLVLLLSRNFYDKPREKKILAQEKETNKMGNESNGECDRERHDWFSFEIRFTIGRYMHFDWYRCHSDSVPCIAAAMATIASLWKWNFIINFRPDFVFCSFPWMTFEILWRPQPPLLLPSRPHLIRFYFTENLAINFHLLPLICAHQLGIAPHHWPRKCIARANCKSNYENWKNDKFFMKVHSAVIPFVYVVHLCREWDWKKNEENFARSTTTNEDTYLLVFGVCVCFFHFACLFGFIARATDTFTVAANALSQWFSWHCYRTT